jgi:hypothetical protein
MSGQLVGEVIAASAELRKRGLSKNGFLALIAIAEKCHAPSRQGSVRWDHICDGLYGASRRTAERAIRELRDAEFIVLAAPGFNNNHGRACAPIYEIQPLTDSDTSGGIGRGGDSDKTGGDSDKTGTDSATHPPPTCGAPTLDGSIDGSTDGKEPPYPPKRERPPAQPLTPGSGRALAKFDRLNDTARSLDAYRIAEAFSASLPVPIETGLLGGIGAAVDKCLNAGIPAPPGTVTIRAGHHPQQTQQTWSLGQQTLSLGQQTPGWGLQSPWLPPRPR